MKFAIPQYQNMPTGRVTRLDYGWASGDDILKKNFSYYSWSTPGTGGLLQEMTAVKTAGSTVLQDLAYTYDNVGNITGIENDAAGETAEYSYDALNRLTEAVVNDGEEDVYTEVFEYDPLTGGMSAKGPDT